MHSTRLQYFVINALFTRDTLEKEQNFNGKRYQIFLKPTSTTPTCNQYEEN